MIVPSMKARYAQHIADGGSLTYEEFRRRNADKNRRRGRNLKAMEITGEACGVCGGIIDYDCTCPDESDCSN